MLIEPLIFFALIAVIFAVSASLIVLIASYVKVLKKYDLLLQEEEKLKIHDHKKEIEILENARQKAAKIIGEAHFVDDRNTEDVQNQLKTLSLNEVKDFEKAANDLLNVYRQEIEELKSNSIKATTNITKDIEKDAVSELKDFKETLKKETYASQKIVEEKIEKDYLQAKKEIDVYKQERFKKVEDEIYNIIQNISALVLGKSLSVKDHAEIILDALEKAKKENVL